MRTSFPTASFQQAGSALALTMIMVGVALAMLAGAMTWSVNTTRLTHRSVQHARSIAAAEAGTEKILSQMTQDFLTSGERRVQENLASYRSLVPMAADSAFWENWQFSDGQGQLGRSYIMSGVSSNYVVLNSTYAGLRGFVSSYTVISHARDRGALQNVVAGVMQEVQLARIPVFQFAMYSSSDMEISCGQPFAVTGRVHANRQLYVEPDSSLTFQSDVTAVNNILFQRHPLDTRSSPSGSVVYEARKDSHVAAMTLPIGTTNTPEAIREIIHPPPVGEDPSSPMGRVRYFNQADMLLVVTDLGVTATSGRFNNFATLVPAAELESVITTTNSFRDAREGKTVRPIDIDIGAFAEWSRTNSSLRIALGSREVTSIYVWDRRLLAGTNLGAVRVLNGRQLPVSGFTVVTPQPLYVQGHYNQYDSVNLGTANTATTRPASLVADAVTLLSGNWLDSRSTAGLSSRTAAPTTVNAAILTGVVETTYGKYSGGMENFPRFLEKWGASNPLTYNGSMVKMFPSLYATNAWGKSDVYDPPKRNWAYDVNFNDATKLPPLTPSLLKVIRGQWATVAPDQQLAADR